MQTAFEAALVRVLRKGRRVEFESPSGAWLALRGSGFLLVAGESVHWGDALPLVGV